MGALLYQLAVIAGHVVTLFIFLIFASIIMSWLVMFNVVNPYNPAVRQIMTVLDRATEPLLRPARRFVPSLGGLDLSAFITILFLSFIVQGWLIEQLKSIFAGM